MTRVVIVGAKQAGSSAALELRGLGFRGEIILIGDEPIAPYQRPPLSKSYLLGKIAPDRVIVRHAGRPGARLTGTSGAMRCLPSMR